MPAATAGTGTVRNAPVAGKPRLPSQPPVHGSGKRGKASQCCFPGLAVFGRRHGRDAHPTN